MCVCISVSFSVFRPIYLSIFSLISLSLYIYIYIYIYICVCVCVCVCIYIYIYIYILLFHFLFSSAFSLRHLVSFLLLQFLFFFHLFFLYTFIFLGFFVTLSDSFYCFFNLINTTDATRANLTTCRNVTS